MTRDAVISVAPGTVAPSRIALFTAFLKVGALGFGGVASLARHVLVVERRILDEREFAEAFGLASVLPGANTVNLATMLGDRFGGPLGSLTAVLGLMGAPLAILIVAATLFTWFSDIPDVRAGLVGAAAAAAGLVGGTSLRLLKGLDPDIAALSTAAGVCIATVVFKVPLLLILAVAIPLSIALGILRLRRTP